MLLASLVGCSPTATDTPGPAYRHAGRKIPLAFVTNNASEFWSLCHDGTIAAEKELGNVDVQFVLPAGGNAANQQMILTELTAKGVRGIAVSPADPDSETPCLNDIAARTNLITCDSDAPASTRLCYIGTDNHAAGVMAGKLVREALPSGGKIILFVGRRYAQNAKDREAGIRDALAGSKVAILEVRTDNTDKARAKANAADALVKYPDIAGMVGLWSYNTPAILKAVEDADKVGKVAIIGFDQDKGTIAGIKTGAVYGTVIQNPYQFGYQSVKLLERLASGDRSVLPSSKMIIVPARPVKSADVSSLFVK